jgi:hypothetical protein
LWPDGGYYLDNGASVCEEHHKQCEMTTISVEDIRIACGITKKVLPPHLYSDVMYDKWGNVILDNGSRLRGELFYDESVQKILAQGDVLDTFVKYVKYPRTYHVPWSENLTDDDRMMPSTSSFTGRRVIVTEKMDGENTTMYDDYIHARSLDSRNHESRNWVKQYWSQVCYNIPPGWRLCGENLYAKHSIHYNELPTYFMGFSVWDDKNVCLSWDDTNEWFQLLGVQSVPVLYDDIYDERAIRELYSKNDWGTKEGYVIRVADAFPFKDFKQLTGKYVRKNHVQTVKHWMHGMKMEINNIKDQEKS